MKWSTNDSHVPSKTGIDFVVDFPNGFAIQEADCLSSMNQIIDGKLPILLFMYIISVT